MVERKPLNRDSIAFAAMKIVASQGIDALSMRTLAASLSVKAPSLYEHVKNRADVIALVQTEGLRSFGVGFGKAGKSARAKILFYRDWALANPRLYPVVFQQILQRDLIEPGIENAVLAQVVAAAGGSHVQARVLWAQLHGLVDLQLQGRLPADADMKATWDAVVETVSSRGLDNSR
jgi:AcrR family transcriptional regulator